MVGRGGDVVIQFGDITARLTHEQVRVMCLVAKGLTYQEIGAELGMSRRTVQARVCDVQNRLGMESRVEALLAMRDAGVLA